MNGTCKLKVLQEVGLDYLFVFRPIIKLINKWGEGGGSGDYPTQRD